MVNGLSFEDWAKDLLQTFSDATSPRERSHVDQLGAEWKDMCRQADVDMRAATRGALLFAEWLCEKSVARAEDKDEHGFCPPVLDLQYGAHACAEVYLQPEIAL